MATASEIPDEVFMAEALNLARQAEQVGEVPVGAVMVVDGQVVSRAHNQPLSTKDPTAHAEMIALRRAAEVVGNYRLSGASLFVTLEPCVMCAGALVQARVSRVVFGASDSKAGACGSLYNIPEDPRLNHRVSITRGVLAKDCRNLLRSFFETRRG